ncbi:MAG: phosphoglycerate mutase family protein [Ilumatobacteraceae bacterium]
MAIYLVRHAKAGRKSQWHGPDITRPLDEAGRIQAKALATKFSEVAPTKLMSSPFLRCVQTLQDLSEMTGLPVLTDERLAEESDLSEAIQLLERALDGAVICSHGDMIPAVIQILENRGMTITTTPDWRKASVWVLERKRKSFISAAVWPPPSAP